MVVVYTSGSGTHTLTISDTLSSTWTKAVDNGQHCVVWFAKVPSTGANSVTVSIGGGGGDNQGLAIAEYSYTGATGYTLDGTATNSGSGQSTSSGSIAVSGSSELVVTGLSQNSFNMTDTPGTGFTQASAETAGGSGGCGAYQDYALNASTAMTNSSSFSVNAGQAWYAAGCSISAASPTVGPAYFLSCGNDAGATWVNPASAENAPDGSYATNNGDGTYLICDNWADYASLPSVFLLTGIEVDAYCHRGTAGSVSLAVNGTDTGGSFGILTAGSVSLGTADAWVTLASDLSGMSQICHADANFGVKIKFGTPGSTISVDSVRITVYYSTPSSPIPVRLFFKNQTIVTASFW